MFQCCHGGGIDQHDIWWNTRVQIGVLQTRLLWSPWQVDNFYSWLFWPAWSQHLHELWSSTPENCNRWRHYIRIWHSYGIIWVWLHVSCIIMPPSDIWQYLLHVILNISHDVDFSNVFVLAWYELHHIVPLWLDNKSGGRRKTFIRESSWCKWSPGGNGHRSHPQKLCLWIIFGARVLIGIIMITFMIGLICNEKKEGSHTNQRWNASYLHLKITPERTSRCL